MTPLGPLYDVLSPTRPLLNAFRSTWGQVGSKDGWLVSRYFDLTRQHSPASCVDDKTWRDLEFPKIFADMDTTVTPLGGQVLFRRLRTYVTSSDALSERYSVYETLRTDKRLREEIQLRLTPLRADSNADIADYIFGQPPEKPGYHVLIKLWSLLSVLSLVAVPVLSVTPLLWLAIVAINYGVIHLAAPRLHRDVEAFKSCARLLRVADRLGALQNGLRSIPILVRLTEEAPRRAEARSALRWFSLTHDSITLGMLSLFLNVAFLTELVVYLRAVDRFGHLRSVLDSTFRLVGSLDAAIASASFLERFPEHCTPVVSSEPVIWLEEGYHPLIAAPVKNSIKLEGRSALLTGSNMAGKTTFIKMVGINIIFGRTMGFCFAAAASIPRSGVMASIHGEHSVESGKSHYFAEMEAVLSFINGSERGECKVFLIDELFSGTNTIERIAAARAVLKSIGANAQVLVTTHDVELQGFLSERFALYHFQEDPEVEGFFDYRLRRGPTAERNAIRLLARMGFPEEVVRNAMSFAQESDRR
jgi:hypothetical protein